MEKGLAKKGGKDKRGKKELSRLHYFFISLLSLAVIFELVCFIRLKPFSSPLVDLDQYQFDFVTELLLERQLQQIPLEEKIGALFMVGLPGPELTPETKEFLNRNHFRHFLLLGRNITDPDQLKELTQSLRFVNPGVDEQGKSTPGLTEIIAVDQEGGQVSRVRFDQTDNTSQAEISDQIQAYQVAKKRGEMLQELGINLNFSPVVEVVRNDFSYLNQLNRVFKGDEEKVTGLSQALIKGYRDSGLITSAKHFPGGLGRLPLNPHQALPVLDISREELNKDLTPFKKLIADQEVEVIMVSHLLYPQIDNQPTSLSQKFMTDILREELSFQGIIITDDLAMAGVTNDYSIPQAGKMAFSAGADLILISGPASSQEAAAQTILETVRANQALIKKVNSSVKRIGSSKKSVVIVPLDFL